MVYGLADTLLGTTAWRLEHTADRISGWRRNGL